MKKVLSFSVGLILIGNFLFAQPTFTAVASGNWNSEVTWGTGVGTSIYPGSATGTTTVTIPFGIAVTLNVTPAFPIGSLLITAGNGNNGLTISDNQTLTVTGPGAVLITSATTGGGPFVKSLTMNGPNAQLICTTFGMLPGNADDKTAVLNFNNGGIVNVSGNLTMPGSPALDQRTSINFVTGGTLIVGGNLSGGTINGGTGTATITGNLTGATDINVGTGTVTINGNMTGGTVNPVNPGTLNITGNVTNDSLNAGSCIINIGGNVSNNPVDVGFTGTIGFNGSGIQTTPATPLTIANLEMKNAASILTLSGNLTVTGTLTLTNGKINTGTNLLILTNATPASQLSGGSSTSYVYSTGAGRLQRNGLAAAIAYPFPIGTATLYLPVSVTPTITSNFAMNAFTPASTNGVQGGPVFADVSRIVNAVWNIDRLLGTGNSTITIQWDNSLEGATFATYFDGQIGVSRNVAGSWTTTVADGASAVINQVTATFNAFGPFGVGQLGVVLPVKFGAIKAYEKLNGIQLDWKVYSENKVRSYEVERSADGRSYTTVGSLPALYNNTSDGDYGFFDANPLPGTSYYRIKNTDLDGKSAYSIVLRVNRNKTIKGLSLYPNPVLNGIVLLQGSDLIRGNYKINIFGANGQEIYKQQLIHNGGTISHTIELPPAISKGVYMFSVKDENGNIIFKEKLVNQ